MSRFIKTVFLLLVLSVFPNMVSAQWTAVATPPTLEAASIAGDSVSGKLVLGHWSQYLIHSSDRGQTWHRSPSQTPGHAGANGLVVRLPGGFRTGSTYWADGQEPVFSFMGISTPAVALGDTLYAGVTATAELYRSTDGGNIWTKHTGSNLPSKGVGVTRAIHSHGGNLIASLQGSGIAYSTDAGLTFTNATVPSAQQDLHAVSFVSMGNAVFAVMTNDYEAYVMRSNNAGATWVLISGGILQPHGSPGPLLHHRGLLYLGNANGLHVSADSGATFTEIGAEHTLSTVTGLVGMGDEVFVSSSSGVWVARQNGTVVERVPVDVNLGVVHRISEQDGTVRVRTSAGEWYATSDQGDTWTLLNPGKAWFSSTTFHAVGADWVVSDRAAVQVSSNQGQSWTSLVPPGIPIWFAGTAVLKASAMHNDTLWTYFEYIGGTALNIRAPGAGLTTTSHNLPNRPIRAFQSTSAGLTAALQDSGLYFRANGGTTWVRTLPVLGYALFEGPGGVLIYTTDDMNYHVSTDGGRTWSAERAGPGGYTSLNQVPIVTDGARVYRADQNVVVWAPLEGGTWQTLVWSDLGLTEPYMYGAFVMAGVAGDKLHLMAQVSGFMARGPGSTSVDSRQPIADRFRLNPAYPNPFNPSTVVSYQLTVDSKIRLAVHDLLGREVAVLVDGAMPAGTHEVRFEAAGLASGVYLVRLQTPAGVESRTVTLLR